MGEKSLFYKKFSKEELQNFIDTSKTKKEFMQKIGYKTNSHNLKKLFDRIVQEYDLQNIHFQSTYSTDISGQVFGYLKVLYEDPDNKKMEKHKWICQCLLCGNIVSIRRNSLVSGTTITCGCHFISHGEKSIEDFLKKSGISFQKQKTFSTLKSNKNRPLRFDFYLPDLKTFIEFQGQQHYYASDFFWRRRKFSKTNFK